MKINNIDMKEACDKGFDKLLRDNVGPDYTEKLGSDQVKEMKKLFDHGFSTCLEVIISQKDNDNPNIMKQLSEEIDRIK